MTDVGLNISEGNLGDGPGRHLPDSVLTATEPWWGEEEGDK